MSATLRTTIVLLAAAALVVSAVLLVRPLDFSSDTPADADQGSDDSADDGRDGSDGGDGADPEPAPEPVVDPPEREPAPQPADPDPADDADDDADDEPQPPDAEDPDDVVEPEPDVEDPSELVLRPGDRGTAVVELQEQLQDLGYWLGDPDGVYGELTRQAVYAFQAVHDLARDGIVGPKVREALEDPRKPDVAAGEDRLELDLARQILVVVRDGQPLWTIHISTGNGEYYTRPDGSTGVARTATGVFEILWRIDGWRQAPLGGLYRPVYFTRYGLAVHGSTSVPPWPASHGCARVTVAAMDFLWDQGLVDRGQQVVVR